MNLDAVFALLNEARELTGHADYVVIGSLSILGLEGDFDIPPSMTMSVDVDCYTQHDPGRSFDLLRALGEHSPHHHRTGIYLDAVTPALPSLPQGWQDRLIRVERAGLRIAFLDPNDAALSKYARGEPRDRRWIQGGIVAGVISLAIVSQRFRSTHFLDAAEQALAQRLIDDDKAWFERIQRDRPRPDAVP